MLSANATALNGEYNMINNLAVNTTSSNKHEHKIVDHIYNYMNSDTQSYISATICAIGMLMNVLVLLVLTRKHMRTPTNLLLGSISVADLVTIVLYTPMHLVVAVNPLVDKTEEFAYYKLVGIPIIYL